MLLTAIVLLYVLTSLDPTRVRVTTTTGDGKTCNPVSGKRKGQIS